jgi:cysteine desulfurase/selenocysteine lyase
MMSIQAAPSVRLRSAPPDAALPLDVDRIRADFPGLHQLVHGQPLVYLDNAATSQKPRAVIDTLIEYYEHNNANVHRGVHLLSQRATEQYENARLKVQRFLGAAEAREIIFTRGTTEAINLVAATFGRTNVGEGDGIVISEMEHHSNIVPWQMLCEEKGARLWVAPINDAGELLLDELEKLLTPRTKLLSLVHVSNTLGTVNPVKRVIDMAHDRGIHVLLDGAQAVSHMPVNVRELDCDFYAFSGHKVYGPTGVGVLYGKARHLEAMPPWQGGGEMISSVSFKKTTYNVIPHKFEAGTPNIAGVIGLGVALDYVNEVDLEAIATYEHGLLTYTAESLAHVPGVRLFGTARERAGAVSFVMDGIHPHDIGTVLDQQGIAIRTGHHCTQPLMDRFGVPATARAALAFYNTRAEIDALVRGIYKVKEMFE